MSNVLKISAVIALGMVMPAIADTPSAIFTISGRVISRTCTFDSTHQSISLHPVNVRDFLTSRVPLLQDFPVAITCGSGVTSVKLAFSGTPDSVDSSAFASSGQAQGVALRVLHEDTVIPPDGSYSVPMTIVNNAGSRLLQAGYTLTDPGALSAGDFSATVILSFAYD